MGVGDAGVGVGGTGVGVGVGVGVGGAVETPVKAKLSAMMGMNPLSNVYDALAAWPMGWLSATAKSMVRLPPLISPPPPSTDDATSSVDTDWAVANGS